MKKIVFALIIMFAASSLYAASFTSGLSKYRGKKIYVYDHQQEYKSGILLEIYTDGIKIKDERDIYIISMKYINYISYQEPEKEEEEVKKKKKRKRKK